MQGLLAFGMGAHGGGGETTAALDLFSLVCFWGGVSLLAVGYYLLRTAPASKKSPVVVSER